jgi:hypothetical protein
MTNIRSFNDTMALDRGILETLSMPAGVTSLPENRAFAPPGALRGLVDEGIELTTAGADPLLAWVVEQPSDPSILTPSKTALVGSAIAQVMLTSRVARSMFARWHSATRCAAK